MVAQAGRSRIEKVRRGPPTQLCKPSRAEIAVLKTLTVHPDVAGALRAQCALQSQLEARCGKLLTRVPDRGASGKFDRLITSTDGRKCAVVVAKDALYLLQQGQEDWRGLLGQSVVIGKSGNTVSLQTAPQRAYTRLFGLVR